LFTQLDWSSARFGSTASNCQVHRNGSTSARTGSVPGLSLRKHQRRLASNDGGHAPGAWAVSGHACRIKAASTPASASDDLPTPELPSRIGSLSGVAARRPITAAVSRSRPKKKSAFDSVMT
jgi:hypothetical protein